MKDNDGDTVENRTGRVKRFPAISSCQSLLLKRVGRQVAEAKEEISIETTSG